MEWVGGSNVKGGGGAAESMRCNSNHVQVAGTEEGGIGWDIPRDC